MRELEGEPTLAYHSPHKKWLGGEEVGIDGSQGRRVGEDISLEMKTEIEISLEGKSILRADSTTSKRTRQSKASDVKQSGALSHVKGKVKTETIPSEAAAVKKRRSNPE